MEKLHPYLLLRNVMPIEVTESQVRRLAARNGLQLKKVRRYNPN